MNIVILIMLAMGAFLYAWLAHRKERPSDHMAVVTAVETFAMQMESENDRLIEMIAALRQKMDGYEVQINHEIHALKHEISDLNAQVSVLHQYHVMQRDPPSSLDLDKSPEFLQPKYKEVAIRLLRGEDAQAIMVELNVGYGEIDLVNGLLQNGRMLS